MIAIHDRVLTLNLQQQRRRVPGGRVDGPAAARTSARASATWAGGRSTARSSSWKRATAATREALKTAAEAA
jgi:hypothetical protein